MDNLFARNRSTAETNASLFTDEKTAAARSRVVAWLNEAPISGSNASAKIEMLNKVQEVLLHTDPDLLEEFLSDVLCYSQDPVQEVRRCVVAFIEETCKLHTAFMPRCVQTLSALLRDPSPAVCKRVIQSCGPVYRHTLQWLCQLADISDDTELAWTTLSIMKAEILDRIDDDNDGIRTNAIKFLEGIIIMQTYAGDPRRDNDFSLSDIPVTVRLIKRRSLEDEANKIFELLLQFHGASHISSVNLIACTGTLCIVARMRPIYMPAVVDAIKHLLDNLPPTLTDSQMSSVRKHLKMQLLNMLKNQASAELHGAITPMLLELGASHGEIGRAMPRVDRPTGDHQRRSKRTLDSATAVAAAASLVSKRQRVHPPAASRRAPDATDLAEQIEEQIRRATRLNEQFIGEQLQSEELCVDLLMDGIVRLPDDVPAAFCADYEPSDAQHSVAEQIGRIAAVWAPQFNEQRLGPGWRAVGADVPRRKTGQPDGEEPSSAQPIDEATKRLRVNMERSRAALDDGPTALPKLKQRPVKAMKLAEVTKPLSRTTKEKFLLDAVQRILRAERKPGTGGAVLRARLKILTVLAATFAGPVRQAISAYVRDDLRGRLDLAVSWLYEEYALLQGFTRHSYVKSEHKPDYAYNRLLGELVEFALTGLADGNGTLPATAAAAVVADRTALLREIYAQAPLVSDEALQTLLALAERPDLGATVMQIVRDLCVNRPPKALGYLQALLQFAMHDDERVRGLAVENVIGLYAEHRLEVHRIEAHALLWLGFIEHAAPPPMLFGAVYGRPEPVAVWTESLSKACCALFLALMPYRTSLVQNLAEIYVATAPEMKRTILRSLETPVKRMGPECEELLQLIAECPKGAETMMTRIVYVLADGTTEPNATLVQCVRDSYARMQDVRIIVPVVNGLSRGEVLAALPRLLKLSEPVVKETFARLFGLGRHAGQTLLPCSPAEVMIVLHGQDPKKVELKHVLKATSICLAERDCFTQDVMAMVLQRLVEASPLSTLLMRTMLQTLTLHPRMGGLIVQLLQRLVQRQIYQSRILFEGFVKCAHRLRPHSVPVLMTLPPAPLAQAIKVCPELRESLLERAEELAQIPGGAAVSRSTLDVLHGRTQLEEEHMGMQALTLTSIRTDGDVGDGQPMPPGEE